MRTVPDRRRGHAPVSAGALARLLAPQLAALPPYPGGKRQLLAVIFALIARAIPRQEWSQHTFADAFFGGGAVGVAAQALGWRGVHVNDIAERSALVARALIANDHVRLHDADVLDADLVLLDEYDLMAEEVLSLAERRLGSSTLGWLRVASTPRYPEIGIHGLFLQSDQHHYMVPCAGCRSDR